MQYPDRKYPDDPVKFLRRRDYVFVQSLGKGASGETVLLHDDIVNENFVCKKYVPHSEDQRGELFRNFVQEIKLLFQVNHRNVVRIFNYYIYPEIKHGYILMEHVDGAEIDEYVEWNPERINDLFEQAIEGFRHLETEGILHRDIREQNLMVTESGLLKIIDLGFGKQIRAEESFDNSISVNQWCEPPEEHERRIYDFRTEIYYLGKLFEKLLRDNEIDHFKYREALREMCQPNQSSRSGSFIQIFNAIKSGKPGGVEFSSDEKSRYRLFSNAMKKHVTKIEAKTKYISDPQQVELKLGKVCNSVALEVDVPDAASVVRCFLSGGFYIRSQGMKVSVVQDFLGLIRSSSRAKQIVILANLRTKLDSIPRYDTDNDIPF